MNKDILHIVLGAVVAAIVQPAFQHLLDRPPDRWATAAWVVLVASVAVVVLLLLLRERGTRRRPARPVRRGERNSAPSPGRGEVPAPRVRVDDGALPIIAKGFLYALGAGFCWSISNILLRITSHKLPSAGFEIALLNYVVAAVALIAAAWIICRVRGEPLNFLPSRTPPRSGLSRLRKASTPTPGSSPSYLSARPRPPPWKASMWSSAFSF